MTKSPFANPLLDTAREHISTLFEQFAGHTGYPPTLVGKLACGEPKFPRSYRTANFSFRTYDTVVSRLSALWPTGAPWPAEVPRQAPAVIEPEVIADLAARAEKARPKAEAAAVALPDGAAWPDDIPRPDQQPANQDTPANG